MSTLDEKNGNAAGPSLSSLSQLLRLGNEQGLTNERLNIHLTNGVLARVFRSNLKEVNIHALEMVLGLGEQLAAVRRPILVDYRPTLHTLIHSSNIEEDTDSRYNEIESDCSATSITLMTELVHIPGCGFHGIAKEFDRRGLRPARLRELLTFFVMYNMDKIGPFPIFTLCDFITLDDIEFEGKEFFYCQHLKRKTHLRLLGPGAKFPRSARFLGIGICPPSL